MNNCGSLDFVDEEMALLFSMLLRSTKPRFTGRSGQYLLHSALRVVKGAKSLRGVGVQGRYWLDKWGYAKSGEYTYTSLTRGAINYALLASPSCKCARIYLLCSVSYTTATVITHLRLQFYRFLTFDHG
jgi:hypothetical protein